MHFIRRSFFAALSAALVCHADTPVNATGNDISVITVTETTPAGRSIPHPTLEKPAYYIAKSLGSVVLGAACAGEKEPSSEQMIRHITKVLAKQGYLPATKEHPPTLALMWAWGSFYPDRQPFLSGGDENNDPSKGIKPATVEGMDDQVNRDAMVKFLGGDRLGIHFDGEQNLSGIRNINEGADAISDASIDDLFVAVVSAFDYQAMRNKKKVVLWKTRISCPSRSLAMADTLPAMISIAAPHFGRETPKPVWVDASDKFKGDVKVGDPVFESYVDSGNLPVIEEGKPLKKAPKSDKATQ